MNAGPERSTPPHDMPQATTIEGQPVQDWRDYSEDLLPPLLGRALQSFTGHGYHGTTIRQLAEGAGLSVPGLYHHYPSKHALLVAIMSHAMTDLWSRSTAAVAEAGGSPAAQLRNLVECLVLFHASRRDLAFIAFSEIRSLDAEARAKHLNARDRQQHLMDDIVQRGIDDGTFPEQDAWVTSTAVITMCTGVAQWFRSGGGLAPEELAQQYQLIASRALGAPAAVAQD